MAQPVRLIWANNLDDRDGATLTGTGYSEPIDLTEAESLFFSVVVGDPRTTWLSAKPRAPSSP